jgi:hypothetical protein
VSLTARIEMLSYQTSFDIEKGTGNVPVSVSPFPQSGFQTALESMRKVFKSSLCFSDLVAVAKQGARLGGIVVPKAMVGLATVSSILVKAVLLKAGIPMVAKFEGILQIKNRRPARFVDLIEYTGSSLDPAEIFIAGKMTRVSPAVKKGNGSVLASFWELPGLARPEVEFLPKLKVEIVVPDEAVPQALNAITTSTRTGEIGDGKIFVLPVDNAVRVRTGEEGDNAV